MDDQQAKDIASKPASRSDCFSPITRDNVGDRLWISSSFDLVLCVCMLLVVGRVRRHGHGQDKWVAAIMTVHMAQLETFIVTPAQYFPRELYYL